MEAANANLRSGAQDYSEHVHAAIQQLIEEKEGEGREIASVGEEDRLIHLYGLLSELESLKGDAIEQTEPLTETKPLTISGAIEAGSKEEDGDHNCRKMEEIVRELRIVRRQNRVTHWLLSVLIVVTAVWQLSEVSLLMMMKDTLKNPFKAVGSLVTGALWRGPNEHDAGKSSSSSNHTHMETLPLKPFRMPELPHVGIPTLNLSGYGDDDDDD